jgi:hypothetical protein
MHKKRWNRANEWHEFKDGFVDKFNRENLESLHQYHWINPNKIEYKKSWIRDTWEIALDMMHEDFGLQEERQWGYLYLGIPLDRQDIIEYLDKNAPSWTKTVKKI